MSCIRLFKLFLLLCSVLSGALFAIVWHNYQVAVLRINNLHSPVGHNIADNNDPARQLDNSLQPVHYQQWLNSKGYVSLRMPHEELSYGANRSNFESEANFLFNQTKVLCLVLTRSRNRARALLHTWTRHCNQVAFYGKFSDSKNNKLVKIDFLDESIFSTRTFCRAFVDLISKHNDFHWLLITTDQTYAIVENLRHYLSPVNASLPYYIGRPVHHYFLGLYNAFDSGIVLSLAAVNLLANGIFRHDDSCVNIATNGVVYSGSFDAFISMELAKRGCKPSNTLDTQGSPGSGSRFHPYMPEKHILPELLSVFDSYWSSNVLPIQSGLHCCSEKAITFTGFSPVTMYFIEYLLYHLTAFTEMDGIRGIGNKHSYEMYRVPSEMDHNNGRSVKRKHHRRSKNKGKRPKSADMDLTRLLAHLVNG